MPKAKKFLILTTRGGYGLVSGAQALSQAFAERYGEAVEVVIVDFFEHGSRLGKALTALYNFLLRRSLLLNRWYLQWLHLLRADRWPILHSGPQRHLRELLAKDEFDALVVTSQYIVAAVARFRERPPLFVANIDLGTTCLPLWFNDNVEGHLIPTPEAFQAYTAGGFREDKAIKTTLLVRRPFLQSADLDKGRLRRQLGLPLDKFIALCAGSREGYLGVIPIVSELLLQPGLHTVVFVGNNQRLARRLLSRGNQSDLTVVPWTREAHRWMRAADVIVAKPGKQTTKESVTLGTPFVPITFPTVMPQEEGNIEWLRNRSVLLEGSSVRAVIEHVLRLKNDVEFEQQLTHHLSALRPEIDPIDVAEQIMAHI